ncbi:MAG: nitroreductase family protein, partial [Clostridia bacterium]|nr:nitroreductase family protein [Clostridia bacterium]
MIENTVLETLKTRRACRSYKPDQVCEEALAAILEAGTWAPTGMGRQSPRIAVIQNPDDLAALERLHGGVMGNPDS